MSSSKKKFTCKGTLRQQVLICLRPRTPYPLPLKHCIRVYSLSTGTYLHREGEGRDLNQREGDRDNSSQSWVENTNMTDCICGDKPVLL